MKPIQNPPPPPIGPRSSVDAIVNLQDALLFLLDKGLLRVPEAERNTLTDELKDDRDRKVHGTATANVVSAFREQFQLGAGESVDEPTAEALNGLLKEAGAFDAPPAEWLVRGQVVDVNGPRNDIQVSVFDRDLFFRRELANTGQLLGSDMTRQNPLDGTSGSFTISYTTDAFAAGEIGEKKDVVPDLIFALSKDGRPLDGITIVRMPDGEGLIEEIEVSADDLILGIQTRRTEVVRIVVPGGDTQKRMSEYERVWRAIEPLLPEPPPAGADDARREALVGAAALRFDEGQHRDISFVARETGLDAQVIRSFRAAVRVAADPFEGALPAAVFYALARIRAATDLLGLARLSTEDMRAALVRATEGELPMIPPFPSPERLEAAVQAIRAVIARRLPDHRQPAGGASLTDLIGGDVPDADDRATLWRTYSDHTGTPAEFWQKLRTQPGFTDAAKVAKVQYSFKLGALTRNNLPLVTAIRAQHPAVSDVRDLALQLDTADKWRALLDAAAIPIPTDVPGKPGEQKANYAASLAAGVEMAHPTAVIANVVAGLPATQLAGVQSGVATFLDRAVRQARFDLVSDRIDDLVATHGPALMQGIDDDKRPSVIDQVKRLQRLFRLSDGPESLKALLDAGFNSARELADLPPAVAIELLTPPLSENTARLILARAQQISAAAVHQYVLLKEAVNANIAGGAL